jgi:hypothetical protein
MLIFINIKDDDILDIHDLRDWLFENCNKWVVYIDSPSIFTICATNHINRLDSVIRSLKRAFDTSNKNCEFKSKVSKNILNTREIKNDEKFVQLFKAYFYNHLTNKYDFKKFEFKNYTKKNIISILNKFEKYEKSEQLEINEPTKVEDIKQNLIEETVKTQMLCVFCLKDFKKKFNKLRHEKICKKKDNNKNNIEKNENELKEELNGVKNQLNTMTHMFKELSDKITINNTTNINSTTNNVNIQINNNYKTKKEKLDNYFKNMIDLDTFTNNYKNDVRYHLTKDEAETLIQNSEHLGIEGYSSGLFTYLKKKYCLQLQDLDLVGNDKKYYEISLPFISTDTNCRTHYELTKNDGWLLSSSNDKIKSIVNISDQQIFNHHNKFICYSAKRGKKTIINIFLRKSYYNTSDPQLTDSPTTSAIEA